jgi:hypothetical protein
MSDRTLYEGVCEGGPLNGQEYSVRKPDGILAVNREANEAAIYDYRDGKFVHRVSEPLDDGKRIKTAQDEWRFEVIPYGD